MKKFISHIKNNKWVYLFLILLVPFIEFNDLYLNNFWTVDPNYNEVIYKNYSYLLITFLVIFWIFLNRAWKKKYIILIIFVKVLVVIRLFILFLFITTWSYYEGIKKFEINENLYYEYYVDSYWWAWWWEELVINKVNIITSNIVDRKHFHSNLWWVSIVDIYIEWENVYFVIKEESSNNWEYEEKIVSDKIWNYSCSNACKIIKFIFWEK